MNEGRRQTAARRARLGSGHFLDGDVGGAADLLVVEKTAGPQQAREATSALDVETEAKVKEAIDRLRQNRTTFIIAHRLTTVRDADLVVFLDNGRIVEMGGFAELSARNGRFASLLRAGGLLTDEEVRRVSRIAVEEAA